MYGDNINLMDTFVITVFAMGIVFATLILISFILGGFKVVFYKENKKEAKTPVVKVPEIIEEPKENDEELVAVIAAAIAASTDTPIDNIHIKNITRIPQTTPIWGKMGRQEQIYN